MGNLNSTTNNPAVTLRSLPIETRQAPRPLSTLLCLQCLALCNTTELGQESYILLRVFTRCDCRTFPIQPAIRKHTTNKRQTQTKSWLAIKVLTSLAAKVRHDATTPNIEWPSRMEWRESPSANSRLSFPDSGVLVFRLHIHSKSSQARTLHRRAMLLQSGSIPSYLPYYGPAFNQIS